MAAVLVLIYFDLRVRKEGFDLHSSPKASESPAPNFRPAAPRTNDPWTPPGNWSPWWPWVPPGGAWPAPL